ncbi:MAG: DNA gyrase C-terminal beta-propeller domain-containing protein, partial [Nostoc sp.]
RRAKAEDSVIIGSRHGMAIHFRCNHEQLRPLSRATRGVKAMKLKNKDELVGMDILPAAILATLDTEIEVEIEDIEAIEVVETEDIEISETIETIEINEESAEVPSNGSIGPWVLVITMAGYGKRVPVAQFRLQNRAGQGL